MSGKTLEGRNLVLSTVLADASLHLYTVSPNSDGSGGVECIGGGYAAAGLTFTTPDDGIVQNTNIANMGTATNDWGTIVAFTINSGATPVYWGYTTNIEILNGDTVLVQSSAITITET